MQDPRRSAALLALLALLACVGPGCKDASSGSGTLSTTTGSSDAIATVNGQSITQDEFFTQLQHYVPNPQSQSANTDAGHAVLQQLILNKLIVLFAEHEKVAPTDAEVDAQLDNLRMVQESQSVKPFADTLADAGLTETNYKETRIRPELAQLKLLSKGQTVSDADIKTYYDKNKVAQFSKHARAHIKRIVLPTQAQAQQVYDQIKQGKKMFEDLVSLSTTQQPPDGDLPQWVPTDDPKNTVLLPLTKAIDATSEGAVAPPFNFQGAWWLVKVVKKMPHEEVPMDKVKTMVTYLLLNQKIQSNPSNLLAIQQKMHDFQSSAKITVVSKQYDDLVAAIQHPAPAPPPPFIQQSPQPAPGPTAPPTKK